MDCRKAWKSAVANAETNPPESDQPEIAPQNLQVQTVVITWSHENEVGIEEIEKEREKGVKENIDIMREGIGEVTGGIGIRGVGGIGHHTVLVVRETVTVRAGETVNNNILKAPFFCSIYFHLI